LAERLPPAAHRSTAPLGFEEFFRASFRELVKTAMIAGATLHEAEDATDETLTGILENWTKREHTLTWARRAVVHNFIKAKTRGTRRVAWRLVERGYVPLQEGIEDPQLTALEDDQWVADTLSILPPAQRQVMECIAMGLSRDEIAEALGKSKATVRRHLCDARVRLAAEMHPSGERREMPIAVTPDSARKEA
jgi:RNA polymerase sigma factor (sigma-70 family)